MQYGYNLDQFLKEDKYNLKCVAEFVIFRNCRKISDAVCAGYFSAVP